MKTLICPVCHKPLLPTPDNKSLQCERRHLFDLARQGYVNLHLSHQKKTRQPGDNPAMVAARTGFLNLGHYTDIVDATVSMIQTARLNPPARPLLHYCDIGCGEGYYTNQIHQTLSETNARQSDKLISTGVDISSAAIKAACKRNHGIQWLIASASQLPIETGSQNAASCLFFHLDSHEAARILKPAAPLITVTAGPKHLIELRELLYPQVKPEAEPALIADTAQLKHRETQSLQKNFLLDNNSDITRLLAMTPHFWRSKPDKKSQLSSINQLELTLDVRINLYSRTECEL